MKKRQNLLPFFILCILSALVAWSSLGILVLFTRPLIIPRLLFFFILFWAVAFSLLPLFVLIHYRTHKLEEFNIGAPLRQAIMVAAYIDLIIWLQMGRALDMTIAVFIFGILLGIEILIQLFDRSQWKPTEIMERTNGEGSDTNTAQ